MSFFHLKREAPDQGGLLNGNDPSAFSPADPLRLWIIQVGIIIITTQILSLGLRKIRQPRVIAEVLGGILLGPTALGRIPNFTQHVFPVESRPYLSLVANIGLCLFLFLVGLEIDSSIIKRNAKLSINVALAGMLFPFGLGAALAIPIYNRFVDHEVIFSHFMLFSGTAFSITAFPVLCRILTEVKLLDTTVGIVVLSAGVGNDIVGWTLLALSVALVNAGSGLTALWILLASLGWTLFLLFPVKYALVWLSRRTGSSGNGPTMVFMTATMLLLFGSAFFTDVIGVHPIFGAFLAGIIVPREGGLAIALTEKLEDMVSIIFLPLYFTLSGLSTNLGLLNDGITWAYTIAICTLAFVGKFGGCSMAARYSGFTWREASAIGSLMSCKGLIELIVLNVGLSAGILSQRVFSMFVLEALLLTFMTTPLVSTFYPLEYRVRASATGANFDNVADHHDGSPRSRSPREGKDHKLKTRFTVVLDKIEHLPGMMALAQLIIPPAQVPIPGQEAFPASSRKRKLESRKCSMDALRLIELSDGLSAVMKSSAADVILQTDPLLSIFRMFGELHDAKVSTSLSIVPPEECAATVVQHASEHSCDLVLVPWLQPSAEAYENSPKTTMSAKRPHHPFDALFRVNTERSIPAAHAHFIRDIFSQSATDVALFVDHGHAIDGSVGTRQHLYLPFFGGPDDRLALEFVVQLCGNPTISATVVRVTKAQPSQVMEPEAAHIPSGRKTRDDAHAPIDASSAAFADTTHGHAITHNAGLQSEIADNLAWERYSVDCSTDPTPGLARMEFSWLYSPAPLYAITEAVLGKLGALAAERSRLVVVTGRSRCAFIVGHQTELERLMEDRSHVSADVNRTIGDVATAFLASGYKTGIVVLQAANAEVTRA